jgi:protease I
MSITTQKIALVVDNYFEQAEFEEPLKALKEAGAAVTVIGTSTKELQGLHHVKKGDSFMADALIGDSKPDEFDALVLPGGVINADQLRMNEKAREWAIHFIDQGKLIAAICHAPWLLVSADVVEGRRLTSYYTLQDDIRNAGAEWINYPVILDSNLITSRDPDDIPAFVDAITQWFNHV